MDLDKKELRIIIGLLVIIIACLIMGIVYEVFIEQTFELKYVNVERHDDFCIVRYDFDGKNIYNGVNVYVQLYNDDGVIAYDNSTAWPIGETEVYADFVEDNHDFNRIDFSVFNCDTGEYIGGDSVTDFEVKDVQHSNEDRSWVNVLADNGVNPYPYL